MQGKPSAKSLELQISSQICDFVGNSKIDWYDIVRLGFDLVSHAEDLLLQSNQDEGVHNVFFDTYLVVKGWPQLSDNDKEKNLNYLHAHVEKFDLWLKKRLECPTRPAQDRQPTQSIRQTSYWSCVSAWMSLLEECLPPNSKEAIIRKLEDTAQRSRSLVGILEGHSFAEERIWQTEYFGDLLRKLSQEQEFPDVSYKTLKPRRRLSPLTKTIVEPTAYNKDKAIDLGL